MFREVIVGHDLHEGGEDALALGRSIAATTSAKLVLAGVFPIGDLPRGFEAGWREQEAEVAAKLQAIADEVGAEGEGFPASSPARGLHELAEERGADLVVVGSSRHSKLGQLLAGNVALGLLHGAPCAVGVAPRGYRERSGALSEILVGLDGSQESRAALRDAAELARATGARLRLISVVEPPPLELGRGSKLVAAVEEHVKRELEEARRSLPEGVNAEVSLLHGDPAEQLARAAASDGSLLLVGSRGYGPLRRVMLGSVAAALLRSAPCPVLVEPRPAPPGG